MDPPRSCGSTGEYGPDTFEPVIEQRLAVLDAEIARLTRLRESLARHTGTDTP
ncbi:hypothetical protein [Kitasatospora sp. NPDC008115]|uniref:hypothetical protein n=1 Tax=Kitasatospora sp. NPDC008115 TaxID=3364022 RepID=UPI0036F0A887